MLFEPLSPELLSQIVTIQLNQAKKRLADQDIELSWEPEVVELLGELGYDVQFGARPLKRVIQNLILNSSGGEAPQRRDSTSQLGVSARP